MVQVLCDSIAPFGAREEHGHHDYKAQAAYARADHSQACRGHKLLAAGWDLEDVCRHLEVAESTWHRWLAQYGGMKANDAKRLKELAGENVRLKKLVANQALDIDMLKEIAEGKF